MVLVMTVLTGLLYPLLVTGIAQGLFMRDLVTQHTSRATLGIFGEDAVNVVELNLALDEEM
jgi:K+-transporting ATPase c subunit